MKKTLVALTLGMFLALFGIAGPAHADKGSMADRPEVDPSITDGTAKEHFLDARADWLDSGIVGYRMKVSRYCFCPTPFDAVVTVKDGKVKKVSVRNWTGPKTVPQMFRIVGQAIKREVAVLDTTYHPKFGFPKKTSIDYIAMAVDDEIGYRISGFKKLQVWIDD